MKRILIIQVNWVGDVLFTTPAIRAIKNANPDAFIACLIVPRCLKMLEGNPCIDELILFDEEKEHSTLAGKISLIRELRVKNFDTAISFHRSMTRMFMAALAGIKNRIGYSRWKNAWLITKKIEPYTGTLHRVEHFLNIVRGMEIEVSNKNYEFCIENEHIVRAASILKEQGIVKAEEFIIVNPGGNWIPKRWPKELFAKLCKEIKAAYNIKIVITGAEKDKSLADDIIRLSDNSAISICGRTTLKELAAIMQKARIVIANDSGPMHIAVSQKTPTVAIFGPTSPAITGPYGDSDYIVLHEWVDCDMPCYIPCDDYKCMEAVGVDDVLAAVKELSSSHQGSGDTGRDEA